MRTRFQLARGARFEARSSFKSAARRNVRTRFETAESQRGRASRFQRSPAVAAEVDANSLRNGSFEA
eukprot:11174584-Lingulodinium_polyedra.AAC.1